MKIVRTIVAVVCTVAIAAGLIAVMTTESGIAWSEQFKADHPIVTPNIPAPRSAGIGAIPTPELSLPGEMSAP